MVPPATAPSKQVRCPQCGQWCAYAPENRWRPFCSERCRGVDLGAWASDSYRVAQRPDLDGDTRDLPPDQDP